MKKIELFKKQPQPKNWEELSLQEKFYGVLDGIKSILNPDLCDKIVFLSTAYIEDERQKMKDSVMAPELQELEPLLQHYRELGKMAKAGHGPGVSMQLKIIMKKIEELYGSA